MFDKLTSLGTILEDTLTVPVKRVDLVGMDPENLLHSTWTIDKARSEAMSPATFMVVYVAHVLDSMAQFINTQKDVEVAMPPDSGEAETSFYFFNEVLPIRARERLDGNKYIFAMDTLLRSNDEETVS
jgi:hypothetical protein